MIRPSVALGAFVLAALLGSLAAAAPNTKPSGTFYTAAQAASGAKLYATNCSQCHGVKLEGVSGPALRGATMHGSQTIADIYGFMAQQMPAGNPGSLSGPTYAAIMAYVLKENGHPAGSVALTPANVKKISTKI